MSPDLTAGRAMWAAYVATGAAPTGADPVGIEAFGDSPQLADELLDLVLAGRKRGTATLEAEVGPSGDPAPAVGDHWVMCDGAGVPRCVLRTTKVDAVRFDDVDESFARAEGEGDRAGVGRRDLSQDGHATRCTEERRRRVRRA